MPYTNFRSRRWLVKTSGKDARCKPGDIVTFEGPRETVTLCCKPYGEGKFEAVTESGEIKGTGYKVEMGVGEGNLGQITFTDSASADGSWTAEDRGPWPGDG